MNNNNKKKRGLQFTELTFDDRNMNRHFYTRLLIMDDRGLDEKAKELQKAQQIFWETFKKRETEE